MVTWAKPPSEHINTAISNSKVLFIPKGINIKKIHKLLANGGGKGVNDA